MGYYCCTYSEHSQATPRHSESTMESKSSEKDYGLPRCHFSLLVYLACLGTCMELPLCQDKSYNGTLRGNGPSFLLVLCEIQALHLGHLTPP